MRYVFPWRALGVVLFYSFLNCGHAAGPLEPWQNRTPTVSSFTWFTGIAYGGGMFVASASGSGGAIATSVDGTTWAFQQSATNQYLYSMTYLNGRFLGGGDGFLITSSNGTNWSIAPYIGRLDSLAYGNGVYVGVGTKGTAVSTDGTNFTPLGPTNAIGSIAFGAGKFLAGYGNGYSSSTDGTNWTALRPLPLGDFIYGGGLFVGWSADTIRSSSDGEVWQTNIVGSLSIFESPPRIGYGNGYYLAVGEGLGAKYAYSTNLLTWWRPGGSMGELRRGSVAYGNGTFVVAGYNGADWVSIVQSKAVGDTRPLITQSPRSQRVYAGNSATLGVGAAGTSPMAFQWRKDTTNVLGATNTFLTITNVHLTDAGLYDVVVTNLLGSATSLPAQLRVSFLDIATYAGITLHGQAGDHFRIDYLDNLTTNWLALTNITLPIAPYTWIDFNTPQQPQRFYRAVMLPSP